MDGEKCFFSMQKKAGEVLTSTKDIFNCIIRNYCIIIIIFIIIIIIIINIVMKITT